LPHPTVTPLSCIKTSAVPEAALAAIEWTLFDGHHAADSITQYNDAGYGTITTNDGISGLVRRYGPRWYAEQGVVRPWRLYTKKEKAELGSRGLGQKDFLFIHPRYRPTQWASAAGEETNYLHEASIRKKVGRESCRSEQNASATAASEPPSEQPKEEREQLVQQGSHTQTPQIAQHLLKATSSKQRGDALEHPVDTRTFMHIRPRGLSLSGAAILEPVSEQVAEASFVDQLTNNKSKACYTSTQVIPTTELSGPGTSTPSTMPKPRWSLIVKLKGRFTANTAELTSSPLSDPPPSTIATSATPSPPAIHPLPESLKLAIMQKHREWVTIGCKSRKAEIADPLEEELLVLIAEARASNDADYKHWVYEEWNWAYGEYDAM
jgi:hypothetical protein